MQEAEGEKIMAELKRKKERDALEEEVRVIERQLKTTVRPALALSSFFSSMSTCQLTSRETCYSSRSWSTLGS